MVAQDQTGEKRNAKKDVVIRTQASFLKYASAAPL
jgi:hypothetical protein